MYQADDSDFGYGAKQADWYRMPCGLRPANGTAYKVAGQTADDPDDTAPHGARTGPAARG
ncbi:hypothetical protein OG979_24425 [Actinomadura citrea]|uniref:hypothetical protein n=1 Tax=Actinomadura citrea TaxID=46158 RepID=UPI002E2ACC35|nr:hypothetical protein [Actinomadura citrea]